MRVFHVRTNAAPWGPCEQLEALDVALCAAGSVPLAVDAGAYALGADGDHYTHNGYCAFLRALVRALPSEVRAVLLVADSSVDHLNWSSCTGSWTGWASATAEKLFSPRSVAVDAIRGSGFVAHATYGDHFYARLSRHLRAGNRPDAVVFVGGWNDVRAGRDARACAAACVARAQRCAAA